MIGVVEVPFHNFGALAMAAILVGCARSGGTDGPVPPAPGTAGEVMTGTVSYRERMALPPDALVEIQLSDVSRQDVAATVVAQTVVSPAGRQVPLPFELRYDPARIEPGHSYAVRATIRSEGRLLFTSDVVTSVLTGGHGRTANLMLKRVATAQMTAPASLIGSEWVLEDNGGRGVIDDARSTIEFPEPGKLAGRGACNRFFGGVTMSGSSMTVGPIGATRMACPEAVMHQETSYLAALQDAHRYTIEGTTLRIFSRHTTQPLRFTRATP